MKINKKALELIEKGLSAKTVSKLTESQVETLHTKLFISEQVTEIPAKKTYKVGPKGGKIGNVVVSQDPNTKEVMVTAEEGEMKETETDDVTDKNALGADALQNLTGQEAPHDANDMAPDGMDDDSDDNRNMMGMSEAKKNKPNPWAICHAQVGPKKTRKFERCVKSVKKQLEEGKNPVSLFIESQILKIVEKNLPPRITKGDLLKYLAEASPLTAPVKPTTKPDTKPRTRPSHPGKNPRPGEQIDPKAGAEPTTAPTKPITKPDTKPRTRPAHPGKNPRPGEQIDPKAGRISPEVAKKEVIDVILNLLK
jgi:hypothetical protein